jgi:hypothetical protein
MKEVSLVVILNMRYVTFFKRFKTDEFVEEHRVGWARGFTPETILMPL